MIVHHPKTAAEARAMYAAAQRQMEADRARREGCPSCHGAGHYVTPKGTSWTYAMCRCDQETSNV